MSISSLTPYLSKCTTRQFSKGSVLMYQGEVPRSAFILKQGVIKVYSITPQGEERIVTFYIAGEVFPTDWLFGKTTSTLFYYEALTDCEVYTTSREALMEYISGDAKTSAELLDYYASNYTTQLMRITALEQAKASEKIMYTLYYLIRRYGKEIMPGLFVIRIHLTHQLIASLVGLTRETTAMELSKLKKRGIVTYKGQKYLIERDKLTRVLGEDHFKDLAV